ncbi:MAG: DUF1540 domain-containing protein [Limnochordales bacterium]|nr:DUF1540 domain-containing protein [Limnochordales bacterium]
MPEVRCTVSNCSYWDEGNLCSAEAILVISDDALARISKHDEEIGEIGHTPARVSKETCCYTFRPRQEAGSTRTPS